MSSKLSTKFLDKVERWILGGVDIAKMAMSPDQKYRAMVAYEAYQVWLQNHQIKTMELVRNISNRNYPVLLQKAKDGDETAQEMVRVMGVRPDVPRSISNLSNDVSLLNHIIARFDVEQTAIEKAKVQDASDWLIREGMKMGDARAVKSGADIKMTLHGNFSEKLDAESQLPAVEINITGDVSVIKRDRINYTAEEKKRMARRYGLTEKEVVEMIQGTDGTWQMPTDNAEPEQEEPDYFEQAEEDVFPENEY